MPKGPVRRAQLIAPFGVGALMVVRDGTSAISAGLDHWFERENRENDDLEIDEFRIEEWRLQGLLNVDHFCMPPDFREKRRGIEIPNNRITVPFLRFPRWHFCPSCNHLYEKPLSLRPAEKCEECLKKNRTRYLVQVPFVAMCDHGHIQDFPWREWVHESANPTCNRPMRLIATGGASLAAQKVVCECEKSRTLASIMEADPNTDTTFLSEKLDPTGPPFLCQGMRPWLGTDEGSACGRPLKGSLRSASNLYFADVRSAIYLPRSNSSTIADIVALLERPPLSMLVSLLSGAEHKISPNDLRGQHKALLKDFSDNEIAVALDAVLNKTASTVLVENQIEGDDQQTAFRRSEHKALVAVHDEEELMTKPVDLQDYESSFSKYFSRIVLVHKLRETRALAGFTRVFTDNDLTPEERRAMLWRDEPQGRESWLPAYIVYGEGIFLEFSDGLLCKWENDEAVIQRAASLSNRYAQVQQSRRLRSIAITPRFILLHTTAHLLMNRLTFECGYSSAALRERIYVSDNPKARMAGILIYTAAGDAEGTMGGLVRMGKPGNFEPVLLRALEVAHWCSADPVCMEIGQSGGQGPDSCNLAACHNCALVPETACEQFNRFLDRALVVGDMSGTIPGYFTGFGA